MTIPIKVWHHATAVPVKPERSDYDTDIIVKRDFGVSDNKGRRVGSRVRLLTWEFVALPEDHGHYSYRIGTPGFYFVAITSSTRNGSRYGASRGGKYFATEAGRAEWVEDYFARAEKRARKTFNPEVA